MHDEFSFLFSNKKPPVTPFFQGYCFVGNDYIYGSEGGEKYAEENSKAVPAAEDGCYLTVSEKNGKYFFNTDFHGYKKLFYYKDGKNWVVSNSVYLIVKYLKENNLPITINYDVLKGLSKSKVFYKQLFSYKTAVQNVFLVPANSTIEINEDQLLIHSLQDSNDKKGYAETLGVFIETWVSRIETLLKQNYDIKVDVTGGVDSRVSFALFNAAKKRSGKVNANILYNSNTSPSAKKDFEVANELAKQYGFKLNAHKVGNQILLNEKESIELWKVLNLGIYQPLYLPDSLPCFDIIDIGGAGGENHRNFYDAEALGGDIDSVIDSLSLGERANKEFNGLRFVVKEAFEQIEKNVDPKTPQSLLNEHYRLFRHRLHSGRAPQVRVKFNPLSSKILHNVSALLGDEKLKTAQINFDIMSSLDSSLMTQRYDEPEKSPSQFNLDNLTTVSVKASSESGRAYVPRKSQQSSHKLDRSKRLTLLLDEIQASQALPVDGELALVRKTLAKKRSIAQQAMKDAIKRGGFTNSSNMIPVSFVLLADFLQKNKTE
jgi:hypothetical protein